MPNLSKKYAGSLARIFEKPTRGDVTWNEVVRLMGALGAVVDEKRAGSRVAFALGGRVLVVHKPHPRTVLAKGSVEAIRRFLRDADVKP